jgi:CheY-like chemotaxis protein
LVEDERSVRDTLRQLLRLDDHTVVEANNGAEALGIFAQDQFDVVLTDCMMPFLKGTELAARIKKLAPQQPILMITAYGIKAGPNSSVDAVLRKPFDLNQLRSALTAILPSSNPESDTIPSSFSGHVSCSVDAGGFSGGAPANILQAAVGESAVA